MLMLYKFGEDDDKENENGGGKKQISAGLSRIEELEEENARLREQVVLEEMERLGFLH